MKYLSGGSCSDIMKFGHPHGLEEAAIKIILKDTLKALEYFHANGRIHRDIKAGNIVISETGSAQVADFGVCGSLAEELRTTLCGSPCWMAPEVMLRAWPQGRAESDGYDYAVDIWSLGMTAIELAKGRPPFSEFPPSKVFSIVVQNPPPALDDHASTKRKYTSNFRDFVSLCLQKDPAVRPSASKLLKHKFFKGKKSRDYLVSTVLSSLPSLGERSAMMEIPQTLPPLQPSGQGEQGSWIFSDEDMDPFLGISFESTALASSANQSLAASFLSEEDYSDASYIEDWLAPTPSNTLNAKNDEMDDFFDDIAYPTPANTMHSDDFDQEAFENLAAPTPANTMKSDASFLAHFVAPTPNNTMNKEDFRDEVFDDLNLKVAQVFVE